MLLENQQFDIFVASKIGSLKHIKFHLDPSKNNKKCIENLFDIKKLQKDDGITCLKWANAEQSDILICRNNQQIQTYSTVQGAVTSTVTADFATGHIVGVAKYKRRLIAALSSGVVKIWSKKEEQVLQSGGELDQLVGCEEEPSLFATGGKENDIKVWKVGESEPKFHGKNLSHDWLELRQPLWVSGVCFLPGHGGNLVAACSRYGYVRLYDTRAQRRPVSNVTFKAMAATCITPSIDDRQVLVGFGRGQLHQIDLRTSKPDKGYKGCVGSVTSVQLVRDRRLIVSTSLDRHVRVHRFDTKEMIYKQYLTSKLTSVLVQSESSTPLKKEVDDIKDEVEVKDEDEMDELFDKMEDIIVKPKKKKVEKEITEVEQEEDKEDDEDAIKKLLKLTEKKKRKLAQKKREKKAKSVYHNA